MGRPRKRRQVEEPSQSSPRQRLSSEQGSLPPFSGYDSMSTFSMAPMSFNLMGQHHTQHSDQDLGFVNMLPDSDAYSMSTQTDPNGFLQHDAGFGIQPYPLGFDGGVEPITNIEFHGRDEDSLHVPKHMSHTLGRYLAAQHQAVPVEPAESITSDMSNSAGSPESLPAPSYKAMPTVTCSCLSSLYLTLDSLSRLPTDLIAAMRVARNASKIAYDVINCPYCSSPMLFEDPSVAPPMQSFQNFMCLGALIPTACNAYVAILDMIEVEAAKAKGDRQNMWFSLRDIGGLWGTIAEQPDKCPRLHDFDNRAIDPETWRRTMRAILRLDIHGLSEISDDGLPRPTQGLRDIVRMLDERSNRRHERMDDMVASGQLPTSRHGVMCGNMHQTLPQEQRMCWKVLDAARIALDNLIIS